MSRKNERLIVFAVFLFCLALRLAFISQKNLWFDEIFSWRLTEGSFNDIINGTIADIHPPFYYFVLKIWKIIAGDSVFSMRLLSVLLASTAIFFIYPISKQFLGTAESLLVLIFYSVSPLNLFYSQEVRMISLNLLLNAGSIYCFIKLQHLDQNIKYFKTSSTYLFITFAVLSVYTHYFSFFTIAATVIYALIINRNNFKKCILYVKIYAIILFFYSIWIPVMISQVTSGQPWRSGQDIFDVGEQVYIFLKYLSIGAYSSYLPIELLAFIGTIIVILIVIILIGLSMIITKTYKFEKADSKTNHELMILLFAFIPVFAAILISFKQWIELFRYLSFIVPYLLIIGFIGLKYFNSKMQLILIMAFLCLNLFGDYMYYHSDYKNNDYRQILRKIEAESKAKESIYVYPHYYAWGIDYCVKQGDFMIPFTENYGWEFDSLNKQLNITKPGKFWFVLDYSSNDTATYEGKINVLKREYDITFQRAYNTIPFNALLIRFERKILNR